MIPLRIYGMAAAALAFVALFAAYRIESARLKERTAERDTALSSLSAVEAAAKGKDDTITALRASVEAWKKLSATDAATKDAAARLAVATEQLNARSRALSAREEAERASKPCAQVLAIDLAIACPVIVSGMRERARSGVPRQTDRSSSARPASPP
jgi:hypothetical protein